MKRPLQILVDEHARIRRVLLCFETELDGFEEAQTPDYEILEGTIAYCREHLDWWHHPREDALLELLRLRAPDAARGCGELDDQHATLARTTGELSRIFRAVQHDAIYRREELVTQGRAVARGYLDHLEWEEANFFPEVEQNLAPEDWADIDERFSEAMDPLTENPIDRRYRTLLDASLRL